MISKSRTGVGLSFRQTGCYSRRAVFASMRRRPEAGSAETSGERRFPGNSGLNEGSEEVKRECAASRQPHRPPIRRPSFLWSGRIYSTVGGAEVSRGPNRAFMDVLVVG